MIVYGERRWRAAALAGLATVSAVVLDKALAPEELLVVQLVENAVREDLRPVEQARAYRRLMDAGDDLAPTTDGKPVGVVELGGQYRM